MVYNGVTVVSQWCSQGVTMVFQRCYNRARVKERKGVLEVLDGGHGDTSVEVQYIGTNLQRYRMI
jgi:hypothetical protein